MSVLGLRLMEVLMNRARETRGPKGGRVWHLRPFDLSYE